jgi:hypothetical protein
VAVTLTALSLGAGAIYVAGAASAAGGMSAAVAAISARVGATAAAQAPTARRLYKYARKGQRVVQIGQVLGIGGGALAGKALAGKGEAGEAPQGHTEVTSKVGDGSAKGILGGLLDWDENKRVKEAKKTLKNLLEGSVVRCVPARPPMSASAHSSGAQLAGLVHVARPHAAHPRRTARNRARRRARHRDGHAAAVRGRRRRAGGQGRRARVGRQ